MEHAKIVERGGDIDMVLSVYGLINLQGLEIHRFGLNIFALPRIDLSQLRKADCDAAVLKTEFLRLVNGCEKDPFCLDIVSLLHRLMSCSHGRFPGLLLTGWQEE